MTEKKLNITVFAFPKEQPRDVMVGKRTFVYDNGCPYVGLHAEHAAAFGPVLVLAGMKKLSGSEAEAGLKALGARKKMPKPSEAVRPVKERVQA